MKVKKISHVAVMVKDLEEATKLFADLFGLEFGAPSETKDTDTRGVLSPLGIELVSPLTPDGPAAQAMERRGEGVALLAISERDDLSENQEWVQSFLVFHPEYQDECLLEGDNYRLTLPMTKAYARWLLSEGLADPKKTAQLLTYIGSIAT